MRSRRVVQAAMVAAVVLVGLLAAGFGFLGGADAPPRPPLYADAELEALAPSLAAVERRAHADFARRPDPARDDATFTAWALDAMGSPPGPAVARREISELRALAAQRTPAGDAAARWLESEGKKSVWKEYRKEYKRQVGAERARTLKAQLKQALDLGEQLEATGKDRFRRPSPYQADPSVGALNQQKFAGTVRLSYPSKHAVLAAAAADVLAHSEPHREPEFRWMELEIDFSRLYAGGHYRSDVTRGAYLGTLIGDYVLATR